MTRLTTCFALFLVIGLGTTRTQADIYVIDFESFSNGDGLAVLNGFYNPFGLSFDSEDAAASIETFGGSKVWSGVTPNSSLFDLIINSDAPIHSIRVDFLDGNEGGPFNDPAFSVVEGYTVQKIPSSDVSGFEFSEFGDADITLSWEHPGPFDSSVVSLHFSQDLAETDRVRIDNIQIVTIPEPATFLVVSVFVGLVFVRRQRSVANRIAA